MSRQTDGVMLLIPKNNSKEEFKLRTINFSLFPGTNVMVVVEQPQIIHYHTKDREGNDTEITVANPPIQRFLNLNDYSDILFVSTDHEEINDSSFHEACSKANVDPNSIIRGEYLIRVQK